MCGSSPNVSPQVKSAKCIGGTVLGFAIVTIIGFGIPPAGPISALGGLFGTIGGSMLCWCARPANFPARFPSRPHPTRVRRPLAAAARRRPARARARTRRRW